MTKQVPKWLKAAQQQWDFRGQNRPRFAIEPAPDQESVWDYPRPPALVADGRLVVVKVGERVIAESSATMRVLETASPPTFYIPPRDVEMTQLVNVAGSSMCEWKGSAKYWALTNSGSERAVGWSYPSPFAEFAQIQDYLAFYPSRVDCLVDGERVRAQAGEFYGGWVTDEIVGPFKGDPGTGGW